ncbi:hypothetical protein DVH05_004705 [Phytophthora capsici]|nr:hypothetical protein DVH05_004705 [Phytophthora capsici]
MHRKVRPFVPEQFQDDPLYGAPTPAEAAQSKDTKRARLKRRADMAAEAKRIQDERMDAPSFVDQLRGVMEGIEKARNSEAQSKESGAPKTKKRARKASSM